MMHRSVKFKQRKLYKEETVLSVQGVDPKRILDVRQVIKNLTLSAAIRLTAC